MTNDQTGEIALPQRTRPVDLTRSGGQMHDAACMPTFADGRARPVGTRAGQSCVPLIDLPSMTAERLEAFSPYYIEAIVVLWPDAGPPVALTGPEAALLPESPSTDRSERPTDVSVSGPAGPVEAADAGRSVWILSAADPDGLEFGMEENIARHADLVALVDQEAEGPAASSGGTGGACDLRDPDRPRWWPAAGAALDGSHHELSLAVTGITAERARAIGLRFGQLALFELTHDSLRLVPCVGAAQTVERRRHEPHATDPTISRHQLAIWRGQHERAVDRATNHLRRHWA